MAIFNGYVKLPEGNGWNLQVQLLGLLQNASREEESVGQQCGTIAPTQSPHQLSSHKWLILVEPYSQPAVLPSASRVSKGGLDHIASNR